MKFRNSLASGLAISAFLVAAPAMAQDGNRVDANGMPTTHSTPAEHAATANLNGQISDANAQADVKEVQDNAQNQAQQQQYQNQQQQYQERVQQSDAEAQAYDKLRERYAAERAAYRRAVWPGRYSQWILDDKEANLVGQRVEIVNGDRVGTVTEVAHAPDGRIEALRVALDNNETVWIDRSDVRYDRDDRIVMTNLDRGDLRLMAKEQM